MSQRVGKASPSPDVAEEVRNFYDRYPYPRPVDTLGEYRKLWEDPQRRRADYHLHWPAKPYREDYSILIAGCGTSQAAKHAMRWPEAQVTGIDVSGTSVRCTEELKRKYSLNNLQVRQLPVEQASQLNTSFDQIVCTGVLHHLPDPDAGLRALRSVLNPDGAMHLMVYAPYGRTGIYMLQEFCRRLGIRATDNAIRDLIAALRALPPGHPLETLLRNTPDFRNEAELADALLHPQDRAYSVPQLFDFLRKGGLKFGRWVKQAPYSPHCGAMSRIPQASGMVQLPSEEQYAVIELFRGTMVRHSMIAYRDDSPIVVEPGFSGSGWLTYVPIRMPDTICVQERLPPGAAAVLINRTHTFTDLILVADAYEERLFKAIDGKRTLGEILQLMGKKDRDNARAIGLFEQLWLYDQIVFDTSRITVDSASSASRDRSVDSEAPAPNKPRKHGDGDCR